MLTHWSYYDAQTRGRGRYTERRAICGAWAPESGMSATPSCGDCQYLLAAQEQPSVRPAFDGAVDFAERRR